MRVRSLLFRFLNAVLAFLVAMPVAVAHDGPPYPIFVDEPVGEWTVSVWTDPDVGTGTFYYYLEAPAGRSVSELRVHASAAPQDGTSAEVEGVAVMAEAGEAFQQIGTLEFDHRGLWQLRIWFELEGQDESIAELDYTLDVTPPGLGAVDILWFAFPFLVLGGFWVRVLLAQRAHDRAVTSRSPIQPRP